MKRIKKIYECPELAITEISTEDIMLTSGLGALITAEDILGQGEIEWIEIDLN